MAPEPGSLDQSDGPRPTTVWRCNACEVVRSDPLGGPVLPGDQSRPGATGQRAEGTEPAHSPTKGA